MTKKEFLICAALAALFGCQKPPAMSFERPPAPVVLATATSQEVPLYLDGIGKCWAREMVAVKPQISGRITKIHFTDGADVKAGDELFTIDPRPFQSQVEASEAMVDRSKAALDLAKSDWSRMESLTDSRAVSKLDWDAKKNAVQVAQAELRHNEASLQMARLNLEYCSIRSPIDGRTGQRWVDLGNVVKENEATLLTVQKMNPIYADFTIPENELGAVQRNMQREKLKVEVRLPDEPENPRIGELSFLDNAVQEGTGTVKLRATLANEDRRFWPGQFVRVRLILDQITAAVTVPTTASQMSAKGPFVYVIKEDSTAELRPVKLGQRQGDVVVIEQGIKPGERVVVQGQIGVMPGGKVRVEK